MNGKSLSYLEIKGCHRVAILIVVTLMSSALEKSWAEENIQFNTDVLDLNDRTKIDLSRFSQSGYVMPGKYQVLVKLENREIPEQEVIYISQDDDEKKSKVCLRKELVSQLGLKDSIQNKLQWWNEGKCLELTSIKGLSTRMDLGEGTLYINIPQAYLEYTSDDWDPPSSWDEGINGLLFDYNLNLQTSKIKNSAGSNTQSVSGNGTTGLNLGAWRFRADWQQLYNHTTGVVNSTQTNWEWSRYYLYRAIKPLKSTLSIGENYLNSNLFDSFRYTGVILESDDNMLPPNLRGYAPEVIGIAKTNAKVTISQQGRVIYETTVASGPFRIQDLNSAVTGALDVKIAEQDGSEQNFQVQTANIPYLTRPGRVRYKVSIGRPSNYLHHVEGDVFSSGELSWGINSGWSLNGGSIYSNNYKSFNLGLGRDLLFLGALSADITTSSANINPSNNKSGKSYRLSYSKRFDDYDSQVTFAGYRFTERNFMSMSEFLDAKYRGIDVGRSKELYTLSLNKQFSSINLSSYLNYSHQTYWNRPDNNTYSLSLSKYMNFGEIKNVNINLSAYRSMYNNVKDDGVYLGISIPWETNSTLSFDGQYGSAGTANTMSYFEQVNSRNSYRVKAGVGEHGSGIGSLYYTHEGDEAQVNTNLSYRGNKYSSAGISLQGGLTGTSKGFALHRVNSMGGTRLMVDTGGVSNVPVRGFGATLNSNMFGKTVITDINSYYRNTINIDINDLAEDVEATKSVIQGTFTEGAIGYKSFSVISGSKAMVIIRKADGSYPPFGAIVVTDNGRQTGIVNEDGNVWLSGIKPDSVMNVQWDGASQCKIHLPKNITQNLLLPCN
ncbi:outer membrane usher protein [Klebsiella pneumoniae]|uniref:outer membrane usher protein n=1 Tax=Klebsiella pneumoniae TaxID=573 RepID=UPI0034CDA1C6